MINDSFKSPAISRPGVKLNRDQALIDTRDIIWEIGHQIEIRLHNEDTVERDDFNQIIRRVPAEDSVLKYYAYPVITNPTEKQTEKAGLREKTTAIVYTAMLDWLTNGYTMERLSEIDSIRATVIIHGQKYEIADKNYKSDYFDTHLYVVLGLNEI